MIRTGRSSIRSVLTAKDLEIFVDTYRIPEQFLRPSLDRMIRRNVLRKGSIHFSQLHRLAFMKVVHFELSCVAVAGDRRKYNVSPPCYCFMPTSTYPKEWKNRFIFASDAMMLESPPLRDPKAPIEDSVPVLSADEIV
ncbi:hypothetical protein Hanom_Chr11g01040641 [Helianthus anomalus]